MTRKKRESRGRPAHADDPPQPFATTLSRSVLQILNHLHDTLGRPRSEIIAKALNLYAELHHLLKP
jgi:hypothetical protein